MLVTFEGIDGSGKSTQARLLVERLAAEGYRPLIVREPGGTELSERVRELLLDVSLNVAPFAELLLFSAARAQLVAERIRPALAAGHVVVCDRFYDSTTAYQGAGRKVADPEWIRAFNERVVGGVMPDRTYLVLLGPEAARERRGMRAEQGGEGSDRMESGTPDFYDRIMEAYGRLAEEEPERILRLDGTLAIEALHARIWADLEPRLRAHQGSDRRESEAGVRE